MTDQELQELAATLNLPLDMLTDALSTEQGGHELEHGVLHGIDEDREVEATPKDELVGAIKLFEQLSFIVQLYFHAKHGTEPPTIVDPAHKLPEYHLNNGD